jgi:hypothetical protein
MTKSASDFPVWSTVWAIAVAFAFCGCCESPRKDDLRVLRSLAEEIGHLKNVEQAYATHDVYGHPMIAVYTECGKCIPQIKRDAESIRDRHYYGFKETRIAVTVPPA